MNSTPLPPHSSEEADEDRIKNGRLTEAEEREIKTGHWTEAEHRIFIKAFTEISGPKKWKRISKMIRTRSADQVRSHAQKYLLKLKGADLEKPETEQPAENTKPSGISLHNLSPEASEEILGALLAHRHLVSPQRPQYPAQYHPAAAHQQQISHHLAAAASSFLYPLLQPVSPHLNFISREGSALVTRQAKGTPAGAPCYPAVTPDPSHELINMPLLPTPKNTFLHHLLQSPQAAANAHHIIMKQQQPTLPPRSMKDDGDGAEKMIGQRKVDKNLTSNVTGIKVIDLSPLSPSTKKLLARASPDPLVGPTDRINEGSLSPEALKEIVEALAVRQLASPQWPHFPTQYPTAAQQPLISHHLTNTAFSPYPFLGPESPHLSFLNNERSSASSVDPMFQLSSSSRPCSNNIFFTFDEKHTQKKGQTIAPPAAPPGPAVTPSLGSAFQHLHELINMPLLPTPKNTLLHHLLQSSQPAAHVQLQPMKQKQPISHRLVNGAGGTEKMRAEVDLSTPASVRANVVTEFTTTMGQIPSRSNGEQVEKVPATQSALAPSKREPSPPMLPLPQNKTASLSLELATALASLRSRIPEESDPPPAPELHLETKGGAESKHPKRLKLDQAGVLRGAKRARKGRTKEAAAAAGAAGAGGFWLLKTRGGKGRCAAEGCRTLVLQGAAPRLFCETYGGGGAAAAAAAGGGGASSGGAGVGAAVEPPASFVRARSSGH